MVLYYLLKRCTHFYEKHTKRIKNITRSQMIQHSLSNWSTVCTRQNLGRQRSILQYVTCMLPLRLMFIKSVTVSVAASKWELSLASIRVKVNRLHCFHILLSQQMSDAIITSIITIMSFSKTVRRPIWHSTQSICCSAKLSTSLILSYDPITVPSLSPLT